jgi:translation initiation factor 5B
MIRQPIITVLGHVDHGKTSLLDFIRSSAVAAREAGGITQAVGASIVPLEVVRKLCGSLLDKFRIQFTIPGLLFIDTPGHEAFTNLRKRGGSIADLAVVVIDVMQGVQPQTKEAIEILRTFRVPFVVALNKIDMIANWKSHSKIFTANYEKQLQATRELFDNKFYRLLGQLSELGFDCELYWKLEDYTKKLAVVPISAKTGEGVAELIALIAGLAQRFLESKLVTELSENARGTILEIKEETGLGLCADVILYAGSLRKGDMIVIGGLDEVVVTKVKGLMEPLPLVEMRDARRKFKPVFEARAATGIKIIAPDLDRAVAGAPLLSARDAGDVSKAREEIEKEIESLLVETSNVGIILKTDTLGSLEALSNLLAAKGVKIKRVGIGPIARKDVMEVAGFASTNPLDAFILGFNVGIDEDTGRLAEVSKVKVITDTIIYHLLEVYEQEIEKRKREIELEKLEGLVWPAKFRFLPGYVFRQSHPAVFGVEIIAGKLKPTCSTLCRKYGKFHFRCLVCAR